jgi:hypothetical protein
VQSCHFLFKSRVASKEEGLLCVTDESEPGYKVFMHDYWPIIHNGFLVINFLIIVVGNIVIAIHVKRSEDSMVR